MTLKKIKRLLRKARHKLARVALGLAVAERRIKHHKKRWHAYAKAAEEGRDANRNRRRAMRARKYTRRWQKRQAWLAKKHRYLQMIFDKRLRMKMKWMEEHKDPAVPPKGLVMFDGHQTAAWIAAILNACRKTGLWHGYSISGWRSKAYSRSICENMCGEPTCPGTCAGENTNHVGIEYPAGADDVTDPEGLEDALDEIGKHDELMNDLPLDRNHFSHNGH